MTPEAQRIAIATACGISPEAIAARLDWELAERQMQNAEIAVQEFYKRHLRVDPVPAPIPDYLNDLNAMAQVESRITISGRGSLPYRQELEIVCHRTGTLPVFASAAQRAESFLRSIGKWTE
jgi:hypothetical protein